MSTAPLKVGLIVGREWSFPPAFIEEVNGRDEGVVAEFVSLGGTRMEDPCEYAVLIDRISHEVPYYRTYLKQAVLQGATVVNNPFMWTADDKLFGAALATQLGVASPKTIALPNKEYVPGIVHNESLRNLVYPLDWEGIIEYIGLPCILKDAHGGGWKDVYVCRSLDEVWYHYNNSGLLTMILQEFIEWDQFVRCICIGQEEVLPIRYDPQERKYHVDHAHLTPELGGRIVADSLKLVRALGYDMNSMEWAVRDGVPYAIDFMNPAPDMDIYSLTPHYFEWVVKHMADMAIWLAKNPRPQARELRWDRFFLGRRQDAPPAGGGAGVSIAPSPPVTTGAGPLGPSDSAPPVAVAPILDAASPAAVTAAGVPEEFAAGEATNAITPPGIEPSATLHAVAGPDTANAPVKLARRARAKSAPAIPATPADKPPSARSRSTPAAPEAAPKPARRARKTPPTNE